MNITFKKAILYTARSTPKGHVPVVELWHGSKLQWRKSVGPAMIATAGSLPAWTDHLDQRSRNYHLAMSFAKAWCERCAAENLDALPSARTSLNGKRMRRRGHVTEWMPTLKAAGNDPR